MTRRFGTHLAVAPVTLRLDRGVVCTVEGGNGAGKTTLLRVAAGLLAPSTGTRHLVGQALYLRSGSGARAVQTVREAVRSAASLARTDVPDDVLGELDLTALADRRVHELSSGQRARLTLAVLRTVRPDLACLDEPSASLDEAGSELVRQTVARLVRDGASVLVATHDACLLPAPDARLRADAGQVAAC